LDSQKDSISVVVARDSTRLLAHRKEKHMMPAEQSFQFAHMGLRLATPSDIPALADIHVHAMPGDYLPRLGCNFLESMLYSTALATPGVTVIVGPDHGSIQGFVLLAGDGQALTDRLKSFRMGIVKALLCHMWHDPLLLMETVSLATGLCASSVPLPQEYEHLPEIYAIATREGHRDKGLGSQLVTAALDVLRRISDDKVRCLVKTPSERARRFYEKNGFKVIGRTRRVGRTFSILLFDGQDTGLPDDLEN